MENNQIKLTIYVLFGTLILMGILIAGNNSLLLTLAVYIVMIFISIMAYKSNDFKGKLFNLSKNNFINCLLWAFGAAILFFLITRLIPGFSIGLPRIAQSISEDLQKIVILVFAPIVETVFFQSVVFGWIWTITKSKNYAMFGQATLFSFAHIGAYISGFYNYPSFTVGLSALQANIGSFVAAYIFALVCVFIMQRKQINNLLFGFVFHALMNLIILLSLSIIFVL